MTTSTPASIPYVPTIPLLEPISQPHLGQSQDLGQPYPSSIHQRSVKKELEDVNETTVLPKNCWNFLLNTVRSRLQQRQSHNSKEFLLVLMEELVDLISAFKVFANACLQESQGEHIHSFQLTSEICIALGVALESWWEVKGVQDIDPPHCYFFEGVHEGKKEYNSEGDVDNDNAFETTEDDYFEESKTASDSQAFFSCYLCKTSFDSAYSLLQHKKKLHSAKKSASVPKSRAEPKKVFHCDLCDFSASAQNGLSLHKRKYHHLDKNNEVVDATADNPDFHERDSEDFQHQCSQCTRRYKKIHHLERHLPKCDGIPPPTLKPLWQKNEETGRFSCAVPGCQSDKSWTSSFSVWHHFNAEHADMQDEAYCVFKCDACDQKFPTRSMLTRHRNHKHEANFRFQCSVCPKRLSSNKSLKLHMTQHTGEKPFACDHCSYRAITQSIVNQHKLRMHEGSMPDKVVPNYVCDVCGKSFKVKSNLKDHMASHSDARSFLCGICGKSLKNRQCLNRHLFTHGVKQTCSICNRNFANATSLGIHQREKHGLRN